VASDNPQIQITAAELARRLGGEVAGDGEAVLTGAAPADAAGPGDVTFAENEKYLRLAEAGRAAAVLVGRRYASPKTLIVVSPVRVAMARTLALFYPEPEFPPGVHPSAVIEPDAVIDPTAYIGPHCVVGRGARIGPRCALEGGVHVGAECRLGEACRLFPRVVLYPRTRLGNRVRIHAGAVIGADGYGYVFHEGAHVKIPQVGWVEIGDDVEIGANVTIDRGAMGPTVVGAGTKIDNLVQLGHNVALGKHCLLVSQVGVAGSVKMGDYVTCAGQVGVAGHLQIGSRATIGAKAGVMHSIPEGQMWLGIPACPAPQAKRQLVAIQRLPELLKRVARLEREFAERREQGGKAAPEKTD